MYKRKCTAPNSNRTCISTGLWYLRLPIRLTNIKTKIICVITYQGSANCSAYWGSIYPCGNIRRTIYEMQPRGGAPSNKTSNLSWNYAMYRRKCTAQNSNRTGIIIGIWYLTDDIYQNNEYKTMCIFIYQGNQITYNRRVSYFGLYLFQQTFFFDPFWCY